MLEYVALPAVTSFLGDAAGPMLGRAAGSVLGKKLGKILEAAGERKQAAEASASAFDLWLASLHREYEERGFDEVAIAARFEGYLGAVNAYLEDDVVSDELLKPFTEPLPSPRLDARRLAERWRALKLPAPPAGFDFDRACRWYVEELNRLRTALDVLRPHWQAQAQQRILDLAAAIRGSWAEWDPDQYADAMRDTYQVVDVTTLELSGRQGADDELVRLRDIFIAQDARRSRPRRIVPRDYLAKRREKKEESEDPDPENVEQHLSDQDAGDDDRWEQTAREPVFEVLTSNDVSNVVILGDPGAGKSCLARYICLCLLEGLGKKERRPEPVPRWVDSLAGRLPFLIELRRYMAWEVKDDSKDGFLGYLHHRGCNCGFGLNATRLEERLLDVPSLTIFDGLDEVTDPKARDSISKAITSFARRFPRSKDGTATSTR